MHSSLNHFGAPSFFDEAPVSHGEHEAGGPSDCFFPSPLHNNLSSNFGDLNDPYPQLRNEPQLPLDTIQRDMNAAMQRDTMQSGTPRRPSSFFNVGWSDFDFLSSSFKVMSTAKRGTPHNINSSRHPASARAVANEEWTMANDCTVAAVIDNRAGEVGVAMCSLRTLTIVITQFGDSSGLHRTLSQLDIYRPIEILLPHTAMDSKLATTLLRHFGDVTNFTAVHRKEFNESKGANRLLTVMSTREAVPEVTNNDRYLCVAAANALLRFLEVQHGFVLLPQTVRVVYRGLDNFLELDRASARCLWVLRSGRQKKALKPTCVASTTVITTRRSTTGDGSTSGLPTLKNAKSLVQAVDFTSTLGGRRTLILNLLQPLRDVKSIVFRQQTVAFLCEHTALFSSLRAALRKTSSDDLDKIIAAFAQRPRDGITTTLVQCWVDSLLALRFLLHVAVSIREILKPFVGQEEVRGREPQTVLHELFVTMEKCELESFLELLDETLDVDVIQQSAEAKSGGGRKKCNGPTLQVQQCFAIKPRINSLLDLARKKYTSLMESMFEYCDELKEKHQLVSLRIAFDKQRDYHLCYDIQHDHFAPVDVFERKYQAKGSKKVTCTTAHLATLRSAVRDTLAEVSQCQETSIEALLQALREGVSKLQALCDCFNMLDFFVSLAAFAKAANGVRPVIEDDGPLAFKSLRHLVCTDEEGRAWRPSTITIDASRPVVLFTGPNASGKSSLLRAVGHATILAHIGSFVPCSGDGSTTPCVRRLDRMVAIIPKESVDALSPFESSFFSEMHSLAFAGNVISRQSLVLADELGRGTSTSEASCLCQAVLEWLADMKCLAIFTTHIMELTLLATASEVAGNNPAGRGSILQRKRQRDIRYVAGLENQHLAVTVQKPSADCSSLSVPSDVLAHFPSLVFTYEIRKGPCQVERYGLTVAQQVGVSTKILQRAATFASLLEEKLMKEDSDAWRQDNDRRRVKERQRESCIAIQRALDVDKTPSLDPSLARDRLLSFLDARIFLDATGACPLQPESERRPLMDILDASKRKLLRSAYVEKARLVATERIPVNDAGHAFMTSLELGMCAAGDRVDQAAPTYEMPRCGLGTISQNHVFGRSSTYQSAF